MFSTSFSPVRARRRRLPVTASLLLFAGVALAGCSDTTGSAGIAANISIVSGSSQSGTVGTAVASPLVVKVTDSHGDAVSGAAVTFASTASGTIGSPTVTTGADGKAQTSFILGPTAGTQIVTATVAGVTTPTSFSFTALVATASAVTAVSGNNQSGAIGAQLAAALVVKAQDLLGTGVAGATINWTTTAGTLGAATTTTAANGQTQNTFTLPGTAGTATITATLNGTQIKTTFTATAN
ncbi:MAG: hypothetical protein ABJC19_09605 [Gemmatimonadota bacterium]